MKRCFIAINLPTDIKETLADLINQIKKNNQTAVIAYTKPEGTHLTLHFLGNLDEKKITAVEEILNETVAGHGPIELKTGQIEGFPNLYKPRVLYLAVQENGESNKIIKLQKQMGERLKKIGIEIDERAWQPHLTVARIKDNSHLNFAGIKTLPQNFMASSIDLMESQLMPTGAQYSILKSYKLKS